MEANLRATKAVIEARVAGTIAAAQPKSLAPKPGAAQFIKYTPAKQGPEYNSGASHRVINMHEVAVDPLEPPKFRHKKVTQHCLRRALFSTCALSLSACRSPGVLAHLLCLSCTLRHELSVLRTSKTGRSRPASPIGRTQRATQSHWISV